MPGHIKVCVDRRLSEELLEKAYHAAISENPENKPSAEENPHLNEHELALVSGKKWKNGRVLKVSFMDGEAAVRQKVASYAHIWSRHANIKFDFGDHEEAEIRISFQLPGSWSFIGTDALSVPKEEPTMNFGWLTPDSTDEEYERVVVHEFGHALGCIHEHQNPSTDIPWDEDAVYDFYTGPPNNWPKVQVFHNLLQKYSVESTQYSSFDKDSIMLYPIPQEHTIGDYEVGWNRVLSAQDKAFIGKMYPSARYYVNAIESAIADLDRSRVSELCRELIKGLPAMATPFSVRPARTILHALRRKRYFVEMCQLADALISNGLTDAQVKRQYSQALIELGQFAAALRFLEEILDDDASSKKEISQATGLKGRLYKQAYVNSPDAALPKKEQLLNQAIQSYKSAYDLADDSQLWHGINLIALLARAQRDGIAVSVKEDFRLLAKHIIEMVIDKDEEGEAGMWDYGTAIEAAVALGQADKAAGWAKKFVAKGPNDFELYATLRQLEQVWQLDESDPLGHKILPFLKAALLETENGDVNLSFAEFSKLKKVAGEKDLELVYGTTSYKRIEWLQKALSCCQAIGLVSKNYGNGIGTGFVIKGNTLSPKLKDDWYFLTNSHVITNDAAVIKYSPPGRRPLLPREARITFELLFERKPHEYKVKELVWTSPPDKLDATLVRLDQDFYEEVVTSYSIYLQLPDPEERPRIYIAGHPGGQRLTISLQDNHLIEFDDQMLQYRTPTDPGSSGSPIFNSEWELVGIHHAGSRNKASLINPNRTHEANEGIRIGAIIKAIEDDLT